MQNVNQGLVLKSPCFNQEHDPVLTEQKIFLRIDRLGQQEYGLQLLSALGT